MKASKLIKELQAAIKKHGDLEVFVWFDDNQNFFSSVGEVGMEMLFTEDDNVKIGNTITISFGDTIGTNEWEDEEEEED